MKLNKLYNKMALAGYVLMFVSAVFTACSDTNDWDIDPQYDRLFHSSTFSVKAYETSAEVTFQRMPDTDYYVIEYSTDSLYNEIEMGGTENSVVIDDKSITKSPYTINNLAGSTKYFIRIKSCSNSGKGSNWKYLEDYSFKTKDEQIFNNVTDADRFEDHIVLSWLAGASVTNIVVTKDGETVQDRILTDEEIMEGKATVTGLSPASSYTFTIYNGNAKRGSVSASTTAAMPAGDYKVQLPSDITVIDQTTIDEIVADAQTAVGNTNVSVTIGIPAGLSLDVRGISNETGEATSVKIPEGVSVTFFGLSGGEKPVLNFVKSFNIEGGHNYIRFENLTIIDGGCQYFINQSSGCSINELSFVQCAFSNFDRSIIRTQGTGVISIDNIKIDDCIFTNLSTGNGYSVFYFGTTTTNIGKLDLSNSTFDTSQRSFIEASKAPITNGVFITDCTFYNNVASSRYFMDANGQATDLSMTRTIIGKTFAEDAKGVRSTGTLTFIDCIRAKDCIYVSNDMKDITPSDYLSTEIFVDPDNHDFTLKINKLVGDPRWYSE